MLAGDPVVLGIHGAQGSCRSITSPTAAHSADSSSVPVRRSTTGMLSVAERPSNRFRNHTRCCARDSGTWAVGVCRTRGARSVSCVRFARYSDSSATVGWSNSSRMSTEVPSAAPTRATACAAVSECPPAAKKLSVPAHPAGAGDLREHERDDVFGGCGGRIGCRLRGRGSGRAARSSFPLVVRGSAVSGTTAEGIM